MFSQLQKWYFLWSPELYIFETDFPAAELRVVAGFCSISWICTLLWQCSGTYCWPFLCFLHLLPDFEIQLWFCSVSSSHLLIAVQVFLPSLCEPQCCFSNGKKALLPAHPRWQWWQQQQQYLIGLGSSWQWRISATIRSVLSSYFVVVVQEVLKRRETLQMYHAFAIEDLMSKQAAVENVMPNSLLLLFPCLYFEVPEVLNVLQV